MKAINTENTTTTIDGQAEGVALLRRLEKLNWNRDAPRKSREAVKTAMQTATSYPAKEFDRFAKVVTDWLTGSVLGFVPEINNYERCALKEKQ